MHLQPFSADKLTRAPTFIVAIAYNITTELSKAMHLDKCIHAVLFAPRTTVKSSTSYAISYPSLQMKGKKSLVFISLFIQMLAMFTKGQQCRKTSSTS